MWSTIPPTMTLPGTPTLDKIPPIGHHQSCINQQHIFCHTNSHFMVRRLRIWNWRLQTQQTCMEMFNPDRMARETHAQSIIITSINNINLHEYPTTGTRITHIGIYRKIQRTWLDAQGIL